MMNLDTLRREIEIAEGTVRIVRDRLIDISDRHAEAKHAHAVAVTNLKNLQELLRVEEQRIYGETTV